MDDLSYYHLIKWTHILSAFLLFGTGLGSAFYKWMADRSGDLAAIHVTSRHVVLADWLFTSPTVVYQPISGWLLLRELGIPLGEPWVIACFALYLLAGACWLPVVWLQIRMRDLASEAMQTGAGLGDDYWRLARIWFGLGWPAFLALVAAVLLMVAKPDLGWLMP
jgi:uncharacterized membrane protein